MSRRSAGGAHIEGDFGFLRVAAAIPVLSLGDPRRNARTVIRLAKEAARKGASLVVFPELALTGYTLGDLFHQETIQRATLESLATVARELKALRALAVVGMPLRLENKLFNVAAVVFRGKVLGFVPKTYIPGYREFYEERWFASGRDLIARDMPLFGQHVPIGSDILFRSVRHKNFILGAEICEDLWAPIPMSSFHVLRGATIIANLSASNELAGKSDYRKGLVIQQSARGICGYVYASSGVHESTTDVVYAGHALICENGAALGESKRFERRDQIVCADVDLEHIVSDREKITSFGEGIHEARPGFPRFVDFDLAPGRLGALERPVDPHPFVPQDLGEREKRAEEIFMIQATGLAKRLERVPSRRVILGISGGLDSALALLVAIRALKLLGMPLKNIHAFSLPGFATTARTRSNAAKLARALGASFEETDVKKGASEHLRDIKHDGERQDITFENVQARYRTMFLMNKANQLKGVVLGTGDLSEIALGWNTFSGDHISHYNVNAGVPKTLVKHLLEWALNQKEFGAARRIIKDILGTPISPELKRGSRGGIEQKTEEIIGPYELHDFFLYHFLRWGSRPRKILFLALMAFGKQYTMKETRHWLETFIERFFRNQWKRSVMSDGPKVGSVALSPRGDWRAPSDLDAKAWLDDLR